MHIGGMFFSMEIFVFECHNRPFFWKYFGQPFIRFARMLYHPSVAASVNSLRRRLYSQQFPIWHQFFLFSYHFPLTVFTLTSLQCLIRRYVTTMKRFIDTNTNMNMNTYNSQWISFFSFSLHLIGWIPLRGCAMGAVEYAAPAGDCPSSCTPRYTSLYHSLFLSFSLSIHLIPHSGGQSIDGGGGVWGGMSLGRLVGRIFLKLCSDEKTTQGIHSLDVLLLPSFNFQ